jgi:hypothetical protein
MSNHPDIRLRSDSRSGQAVAVLRLTADAREHFLESLGGQIQKRGRHTGEVLGLRSAIELPDVIDRQGLAALGFGRRAIDALYRALPVVALPGLRRVYLRRADVAAYLEQCTYADDRVRPVDPFPLS